jgi:cytochrome c biogenesis protein ResB
MSWNYNSGLLSTSPLMQVRALIGDVMQNDQLLQDEEINYFISLRSSIPGACAEACRRLAAQFARRATTSVAGMSVQFNNQARQFLQMAAEFEADAALRGSGAPYAGGISVADKTTQEENTDRVDPQYVVGMDDNFLLPVGGDETPETDLTTSGF